MSNRRGKQKQGTTNVTQQNQQQLDQIYDELNTLQQIKDKELTRPPSKVLVSQTRPASYIEACSFAGPFDSLSDLEVEALWRELEQAALNSDCDKVGEILEMGASRIPKKNLNNALRAAVRGTNTSRLEDTLQCIEDLIRANALINAEESEEGRTALMLACEKGYLEVV